MKRLLLLRHAKAETPDANSRDEARALAKRGREDAALIGAVMWRKHYLPDRILCSTAARTTETWVLLGPELHIAADAQFLGSLYLATAKAILKIVKATDAQAKSVLVIGHNPGLEECAADLMRTPKNAEERRRAAMLAVKFPTCALAVLDFDVQHWNELAGGTGALIDFIQPKDCKAN
jgi:phosphohistidine phosphatase